MSIACFCAAVKLLGAMILFDSGQMTCDSFKSSSLDELEGGVFGASTAVLTEVFGCVFELDEDEEDFNVDGFAGTRRERRLITEFSKRR